MKDLFNKVETAMESKVKLLELLEKQTRLQEDSSSPNTKIISHERMMERR